MAAVSVFGPIQEAQVIQVKDGDTFELKAEIFPGLSQTFLTDLTSWDAPNDGPVSQTAVAGNARCEAERTKGREAKAYAQKLLAQETDGRVTVVTLGRALGSGRYPVELELNSQPDGQVINFGQAMANAGFAKSWNVTAGESTRPDWCSVSQNPPPPSPLAFTVEPKIQTVTATSAKLTWTTSVKSQSWIEYSKEGDPNPYSVIGPKELSFNFDTHVQTLSNLTPNTKYIFRVVAKDQSGAQTVNSENCWFTTAAS